MDLTKINLGMNAIAGNYQDREIAAEWMSKSGYKVSPKSLFAACGGHNALAAIFLAAGLSGKSIIVDAITYNGVINLAGMLNITLIPCSIDDNGMIPEALREIGSTQQAAAIYLMPTIHNPLCFTMPLDRRLAIVEIAREFNLLLIDDDAYGFLESNAPLNFADLAPERAFYIYSFSKSIASGVKTSYIIVPPKWQSNIESALRLTASGSVSLFTGLISKLIQSDLIDRIIEEKRKEAVKRQAIVKEVFKSIPYISQPSSYHLWLPLPERSDIQKLEETLSEKGVDVVTSHAYRIEKNAKYSGIRIALGNVSDPGTIRKGLTIIAENRDL
ncbi:aminotransferase-like domain-containing protein [Dyadobacter sediminis]|nr:PLP-dependent aminotransferase family protein [Dyadobacter sediminis]